MVDVEHGVEKVATPEEIERRWLTEVYTGRGDSQKQLTLRAVLMGGLLGMLMSLSNLYTMLKLGGMLRRP